MAEKFCECPLPCPCNVPFEGRGTRCHDCASGDHMDRNGVRLSSSLEEARTLAHNLLLNAILDLYDGGYSREDVEDWNTLIDDVAAAARAEVIREVEAALSEHDARLARGYYWPTSAIQLVERLRALYQGGEGKA